MTEENWNLPEFEVTVTKRSQKHAVVGTARRTTRGIQSEILTRISKANKSTSNDFLLITRRWSAMCTFAAFLWNYLNYPATIWHLLKRRKETFVLCIIPLIQSKEEESRR